MSQQDLIDQVNAVIDGIENPGEICEMCGPVDTDGTTVCPECGDETHGCSAFDWLEGCLDIEHTVSSDKTWLGARVLVCFGGPNVWVDFRHNRVDGHWWQDSHSASFTDEMGIAETLEELFAIQCE